MIQIPRKEEPMTKKNKETTNLHNSTRHRRFTKHIRFLSIGAILVLICTAILWSFLISSNTISSFHSIQSTPVSGDFIDDNYMTFSDTSNLPEVNNNRKLSSSQPFFIGYKLASGPEQSAFKMGLTNTDIKNNITITPFVRGTWHMRGANVIDFVPEHDWPTNQKFTIKINKNLFNPDTTVDTHRFTFTTPAITDKIASFTTYPAPENKESIVAVAVVSFSAPIDTEHFNDKISIKLGSKQLPFSVKFDDFHRTAFITTAPVAVTDEIQIIRLKINRVRSTDGNSATEKLTAHTTIESADNIFKINSVTTVSADDATGNAQQLVLVTTTTAAAPISEWSDSVHAYLLPRFQNADEEENNISHQWLPDEISPDVLSQSKEIDLTPVEFVQPGGVYQYAFSYDISDANDRYIYVSVDNGIKSAGGFVLQQPISTVLQVPYPEQTVEIAGRGAILSLSGDKKLGIMARGGANAAYINLYKVKESDVNHLISQTYNVFSDDLEFKSWSFGVYDISTVFQKRIPFSNTSVKYTNYASLDLGEYLTETGTDKTGIFIIQTGADENQANFNDKRLILLTDLGIIRKTDKNNNSTLFISNIKTGKPAKDISVYVLGRNGTPIWNGVTNTDGVCKIPHFPWSEYHDAREPVAIVASRGSDISFIPYSDSATRVDYSRFDIGGEYSYNTNSINAFLFSDRGIYRPGEMVILGGIVKNNKFESPVGIPVKLEMRNSRSKLVLEHKFSLSADGIFDAKYTLPENSSIGEYYVSLHLLTDNNKSAELLGSTTLRVAEFTPDTLKISASVANSSDNGWVSPDDIRANVSLRNLFGTPADNHRITAYATLRPTKFTFKEYPNYIFGTSVITKNNVPKPLNINIPDVSTDKSGTAILKIDFPAPVPSGTYQLNLNISGLIGVSGIGAQTNLVTRVSDAKYLIGHKFDSDPDYIKRDTSHNLNIVALDNTATPVAVPDLTVRTILRENLTSLVKDYADYYKYQTITRDRIIFDAPINIPDTGIDIPLDTTDGGTHFLQILDANGNILVNAEYYVVSDKNSALLSDKTAELKIRLDSARYTPGDEIAININAPYAGNGLITLERDRVYAYKWFSTNSESSVQHITVPPEFEGTGYVNVSFVRANNSRDIFTNPYAYAVVPFCTNLSHREIDINLTAPDVIRDNKLTVQYETSKSGRIMLFAINTGILQVAKYESPNPLKYFFKKSALQVDTYQILSLLLPEYKILHEFAKTGGGDYDASMGEMNQILTNPFAHQNGKPVAFYSGILDTSANETGEYTFNIPDDFNGEIRIFAVASDADSVGAAHTNVAVQSPIVISATAPNAVVPGDIFDINAVITNLTSNSGENARSEIMVQTTGPISINGDTFHNIELPENSETLVVFNANTTNDMIGPGEFIITVNILDSDGKVLSTRTQIIPISVRPATTFHTDINTGQLTQDKTKLSVPKTDFYPEFSQHTIYISENSSAIIRPLFAYLDKYEFPCTEQITSRVLPYALLSDDAILGINFEQSAKKISDTINTLKNRQNDDGSFDLWARTYDTFDHNIDYSRAELTAYVAHFLTIARENGFNVSPALLGRSVNYLRTFAQQNITSTQHARATAYAIYIITLNGYISTSYIDLFTEYANKNITDWQSDLMGAYISASYKLLHQDDIADKLIRKYNLSETDKFIYRSDFDNNISNDAMYLYLISRHFNEIHTKSPTTGIIKYINRGEYSPFTSAAIIMGLNSGKNTVSGPLPEIKLAINDTVLSVNQSSTEIPLNTERIVALCNTCSDENAPYYTILSQGFNRTSIPQSNGIEIIREYYDMNHNKIKSANIGDIVTVKISARTRGDTDYISNAVIIDLLPGGFTAQSDSMNGDTDFYEIRQDRVLIFTPLTRAERTFTYDAQLGTSGTFNVPGIHAESMYNPAINATGTTGKFTVHNNK